MAAIQTLTLQRQYVLSHHRDTEGPLIADWRLRISDLELMKTFSIRTIRNPQSEIRNYNGFSVHLRVLRVSVVN